MSEERSYVIGTQDAEIARLGLQHRVWRASVLDFWQRGGITVGQTVIDAGAGPGFATADLAEIVGSSGRVIAIERSRRFLDALRARDFPNVDAIEADLTEYDWPTSVADRIWCRWVLAFVTDPAHAIAGMARALKPGGAILFQEYWDYSAWRLAPYCREFEDYVAKVIESWRAAGGEPDIGLALPRLLAENRLAIEFVRPVVFTPRPREFAWHWPAAFARGYAATMVQQDRIAPADAAAIDEILSRYEGDPNAFMVTPGVLQIVARKSG
ncbi:MAG TPA: methyltransferase domain-containing protein [Rhizomicrobium sp.]